MIITSRQNPVVKELISLRNKRSRQAAGVTLVDGYEEFKVALDCKFKPLNLYYCPELMGGPEQEALLKRLIMDGVPATELSRQVFEKVAYREGADGWLAKLPAVKTDLAALKLSSQPLVLVCESVEKPGNLGAILRTANAVNADAVMSVDAITDWSNPNVIRASKGAVFAVNIADTSQQDLYAWLKDNNLAIIASTPSTDIVYTEPDLTTGVAIFVGSEKYGLSDFWLNHADYQVCIPMNGKIDSLNVATSAALLLYEARRQRANN